MSDRDDHISGRVWFFGRSPALIADPIVQAILFVLLVSLLFLVFPGIDPWFSGLFYDPGTGFPTGRLDAFNGLRSLSRLIVIAAVVILVAAVLVKLLRPSRPTPIAPADIVFLQSTLVLGPGLVVNVLFKEFWGRPRPATIELFGGDKPFVEVWHLTNHCLGNCSFVSGEASVAIWFVALAVLAPPAWRGLVAKVLLALAVVLSLNRVAMGRHFLSDVLIAWGLTFLVIAVVHRIVVEHPPGWLADDRLEAGLTRLGRRLRDGIGS